MPQGADDAQASVIAYVTHFRSCVPRSEHSAQAEMLGMQEVTGPSPVSPPSPRRWEAELSISSQCWAGPSQVLFRCATHEARSAQSAAGAGEGPNWRVKQTRLDA
jgi:hypothetical protein